MEGKWQSPYKVHKRGAVAEDSVSSPVHMQEPGVKVRVLSRARGAQGRRAQPQNLQPVCVAKL